MNLDEQADGGLLWLQGSAIHTSILHVCHCFSEIKS